jgi:hypothetical protein
MCEIDIKHALFLEIVAEVLSEAELEMQDALIPIEMFHSLSERYCDYVRALDQQSLL